MDSLKINFIGDIQLSGAIGPTIDNKPNTIKSTPEMISSGRLIAPVNVKIPSKNKIIVKHDDIAKIIRIFLSFPYECFTLYFFLLMIFFILFRPYLISS